MLHDYDGLSLSGTQPSLRNEFIHARVGEDRFQRLILVGGKNYFGHSIDEHERLTDLGWLLLADRFRSLLGPVLNGLLRLVRNFLRFADLATFKSYWPLRHGGDLREHRGTRRGSSQLSSRARNPSVRNGGAF